MPAIYTHYSFGKKVYKNMPTYMKRIVDQYRSEFINGLQGPDPLFFYNPFRKNPVSALGTGIHDEKASVFLNEALKVLDVTGLNSPEGAYILGFICHYMLDSTCHGYVERMVKETGVSHTEQETELDRYVMELDYWNPLRCPTYELIDTSKSMAKTMAVFYKEVSTHEVWVAQRRMYLIKRITYCPCGIKRTFMIGLAKLIFGKDDPAVYQFMTTNPNPECEVLCEELARMLWKAVPECVAQLDYFARRSMRTGRVGKRLERTFG